jgi:hypothetical protein
MQHPSNNAALGAPAGWDQESIPCGALPITRGTIEGQSAILSYWRPTADEIEQLAHGAVVCLCVLGGMMPPVSLTVEQ